MERENKTTVKPIELLEFGLDPAVLWNTEREAEIDVDIFIVSTLRKGYGDIVISKICEFFGNERVLSSLVKYRDRVSTKLMDAVEAHIFKAVSK